MKKFNKKTDFKEEINSQVISSLSSPEVKNTLVPPSGAAIIQRYLWEINQYPLLTPEESSVGGKDCFRVPELLGKQFDGLNSRRKYWSYDGLKKV